MNAEEIKNIRLFQAALLAGMLVLLLATARLQLLRNSFNTRAESVTLAKVVKPAARGHIYDRSGKLLAHNTPEYAIQATYAQLSRQMDTSFLCELLNISIQEYESKIEKDWKDYRYAKNVPFTFIEGLVDSVALRFQEYQFMFPGFECVLRTSRKYNTSCAAHVLGYLKSVDQSQIEDNPGVYSLTDRVGATGLEYLYEDRLRGHKGSSYILQDKYGRDLEPYMEGTLDSAARSGKTLVLGLDEELQTYAETILEGRRGAIVALEPETGEILAMASAPSYSPSLMEIGPKRSVFFNSLSSDSLRPLFNRATMARYPPGSIIKPIFSLIALQQGMISPDEKIYCDGVYRYRTFRYGCHKHKTQVNLAEALSTSCNSYFFDTYRRMVEVNGFERPKPGLNSLIVNLQEFGLGQELLADFPSQSSGFMPTGEYYDRLYGLNRWRSTYTISLGIGQGELELTTVQMANLAAILANKGYYITPHLVRSYRDDSESEMLLDYPYHKVPIDRQHFDVVDRGLFYTVEYGTGVYAKVPGLPICGKTGTSQNPHGEDHSVFFAYAPRENPQIALAVYIENGGPGGLQAAPIAGLLIEKYIRGTISPSKKYWENQFITPPNS